MILDTHSGSSTKPPIRLWWYDNVFNFGDQLNPFLVEKLAGNPIQYTPIDAPERKLLAIGSILHLGDLSNCVVWGSGMISAEHACTQPHTIHAVRGPLTRKRLLELGIACPEVYGDPAVLLPRIHARTNAPTYDLGIVPHEVDKAHPWLAEIARHERVLIIDVQRPVVEVLQDILSCKTIASSALHGIIAAAAYGIPVCWLEFSDKVIGKGFKFRDFYLSMDEDPPMPLAITMDTQLAQLQDGMRELNTAPLSKPLLRACPFKQQA